MTSYRENGVHRLGGRTALLTVIVAAHVALFLLLAHSRVGAPQEPPATHLMVTFVPADPTPVEPMRRIDPALAQVRDVQVEVPLVDIQPVQEDTAITAVPVQTPQPIALAIGPAAPGPSVGVPVMSEVAYLERPAPRYPPESKRAREEGLVVLSVLIDESGRAKSVDIYRSSGHPRLDEAARRAIAHSLFKPYLEGGTPRAALATVPVSFSLRNAS